MAPLTSERQAEELKILALQIFAGVFDTRTHDDGTYFYQAFAVPGTPTAAARWRVRRTHKTTGAVQWCDGTTAPVHSASNLAGLF